MRPAKVDNSIALAEGLSLPLEIVTATLAVLANRGGGKSAVTHRIVELMHAAGLPVVVVDVKGDWWGIRSSSDGKGPGLPFVIFGGDHGDVPLEPTAGELLADLIVDDRVPAVLDLSHMSKTQARSFATAFAERLYRRNRDPLHVVVEEADILVPQRVSADTARLLGAMEDLAKRGRHRGIGLTVVSQRGQEVAKSVLDLMETVILLRMTGPRSIKAVQDWINVNADQDETTARTVVASLPTLAIGEGWVWSPGFLRILQRVQFPLFDTFDSHATPKPGQVRVVPKARADIDLNKLGAEIAATRERAIDNDPRALQEKIRSQRRELETETARADGMTRKLADRDELLARQKREIAELQAKVDRIGDQQRIDVESVEDSLRAAVKMIDTAIQTVTTPNALPELAASKASGALSRQRPSGLPRKSLVEPTMPAATQSSSLSEQGAGDSPVRFRRGAQRMLTSLAQMAPLHLTKTQWGMVAKLKPTGGTWSTYLGELRRAGFVDEDSAGYTLTDAGWNYLGQRPQPLSASELQQHYMQILRAGAGRMLQETIDAYPGGMTKGQLAERSGVAASGGTFSTYLGELRRNGLVEQRGDLVIATEILIHGAAANDAT